MSHGTRYQLGLRKKKLCQLFVTWERTTVGVASVDDLPTWGPSEDEIVGARAIHLLGGNRDAVEDEDFDVEFEDEPDGLLIEHLDSFTISENYRAMHNNIGIVE